MYISETRSLIRVDPNLMTALLVDRGKFGHTDTHANEGKVIGRHRGITSDEGGRDRNDTVVSQGMPMIADTLSEAT